MKTIRCGVRCIRLVAAIWVATLALSPIVSSTATAKPGVDRTAAAITRAGPVFPTFDSAADPQSAVDYWTPERMRLARPPVLPGVADGTTVTPTGGTVAGGIEPTYGTDFVSSSEIADFPHTSVGKVFFTLNDFNFVCTACAVTSEGRWGEGSRQLVVTAGHCLNNGDGGFASNFVYVPGYNDGNMPYGIWPANALWTTPEWDSGLGKAFGRDVGFARVAAGSAEYEGANLHDVVDPLKIEFTESYPEDGLNLHVEPGTGIEYASFGYGVANWGGENQVRSLDRTSTFDPEHSPSPMGLPSLHTGGSSGGPWLYNYAPGSDDDELNVINGVNSYVHGGTDIIYSPRFDDEIHSLWADAAAAAATPDVDPRLLPVLLKVDISDPSAVRITATGAFAQVPFDSDAFDGTTLLNFFSADRGEAVEFLSEADLSVISDNEPIVVDGQESFLRDFYDSFFIDSHTGENRDLNLYREEDPVFEQFFLTDQPAFTGEAVADLSGFALPAVGSIGRIIGGDSEAAGLIIGAWVAVPEPSSGMLLALGGLILAAIARNANRSRTTCSN